MPLGADTPIMRKLMTRSDLRASDPRLPYYVSKKTMIRRGGLTNKPKANKPKGGRCNSVRPTGCSGLSTRFGAGWTARNSLTDDVSELITFPPRRSGAAANAAGSEAEPRASGRRGFQSSDVLDQLLKTGPAPEIQADHLVGAERWLAAGPQADQEARDDCAVRLDLDPLAVRAE